MTNGAGGPHGKKRGKEASAKKGKAKSVQASLRRKRWLPAVLAKSKEV
jgi:hypothetical protein